MKGILAGIVIAVALFIVTAIAFGMNQVAYEYKTASGSFGEAPSCWKEAARLVCSRKGETVEVTEFERK